MNNKIKNTAIAFGSGLTLLGMSAGNVFAQTPFGNAQDPGRVGIPTGFLQGFKITSLGEFIGAFVNLLFILSALLVFVYLVWGGVEWITSGGDKAKTQSARDRLTAALVGLAIVAISYAIVVLAENFFGVSITNINFITPFSGGGVTP